MDVNTANDWKKLGLAVTLLAWGLAGGRLAAAESPTYESAVRPILVAHCYQCHSHDAKKFKGELALDSIAAMLEGGHSGPAVVPGKPAESLLLKAVRHDSPKLKMPYREEKLSATQIATLEQWIREGAQGPRSAPVAKKDLFTEAERSWWAVQPVKTVTPPVVADAGWVRNDVDRFILARLRAAGLKPSGEAGRVPLIRRIYFDLIGLPPTPEEVDAFVQDQSEQAFERVADRLLDSPRHGEKWARHWLDLVRYADSDGYKADGYRPLAWRYRDYVIRSFNTDKPYDRFVREQLAGDELAPDDPDALVATGYFRNAIYEYNNRDAEGQVATILTDYTDTTADVFMGVGLQCARCHDHKFDPLLQKDYYRLRAFFAAVIARDEVPLASAGELAEYRARLAAWEQEVAPVQKEIDAILHQPLKNSEHYAVGQFPEEVQAMYRKPAGEQTPYEKLVVDLVHRQVLDAQARVDAKIKGETKDRLLALQKQLAALEKSKPESPPLGQVIADVGPVAPPTVMGKGQRQVDVEPGFPSILDPVPAGIARVPQSPGSTGRRTALAGWLTRADNPLSTRVIVNRVWQYHFGRGLAANASDFGNLGDRPSHPELLDWLTRRFVQEGWSLKKLHRLLVTSAAYRQSAVEPAPPVALIKDPENRLLWKYPTRRLEAEQIRDAILSVTGQLDLKAGGAGGEALGTRRSIYNKVMRNSPDPLLAVFDVTEGFTSSADRNVTTTPTQALLLFNSQSMLRHAQALARRLEKLGATTPDQQVTAAYRLLYGRAPAAAEIDGAVAYLQAHERLNGRTESDSAALQLRVEKMPYRDGQAAVLAPRSPAEVLQAVNAKELPDGDFTIEAFVVLRSLYESGSVRTIAANWSGDNRQPGWAFGVTSEGSARKPRTLVLQLAGRNARGEHHYEPVFSDLALELNKPYYVGVSVKLGTTGREGITFHARDLSNEDEPMMIAQWPHQVVGGIRAGAPFTIGGRAGNKGSFWDGMIDDVRLSRAALPEGQLLFPAEQPLFSTVGLWKFEVKPGAYEDSSPLANHLQPLAARGSEKAEAGPRFAALTDLCHVLLNSNEFLYVD